MNSTIMPGGLSGEHSNPTGARIDRCTRPAGELHSIVTSPCEPRCVESIRPAVRPAARLGLRALAGCTFLLVLSTFTTAAAQPVFGPPGVITTPPPFAPVETQPDPRASAPPGYELHGDMLIVPGQVMSDERLQGQEALPRGARHPPSLWVRPWPLGVLPIVFADDISEERRRRFYEGCALWSAAGVRCLPRTAEEPWVRVTMERFGADTCRGTVGAPERGYATIIMPGTCLDQPLAIAHEVGHVLGLAHEHQRPDRDDYVTVHYDRFPEGSPWVTWYEKITTLRFLADYDFGSVMHYGWGSSADSWMTVRPEHVDRATRAVRERGNNRVSALDIQTAAGIYGLPLSPDDSYAVRPQVIPIGRAEAVYVMQAINLFYASSNGLDRPRGLSVNGRPDFLGLAAWFFDVYVNTRYAGYREQEARYNVAASIAQTDEWRARHPGWVPPRPYSIDYRLPFSRAELFDVMERLDRFYAAPEGLRRPQGLSLDGQPDFVGIAVWVVDVYMSARLGGVAPESAWDRVTAGIRQTDEWRSKR